MLVSMHPTYAEFVRKKGTKAMRAYIGRIGKVTGYESGYVYENRGKHEGMFSVIQVMVQWEGEPSKGDDGKWCYDLRNLVKGERKRGKV